MDSVESISDLSDTQHMDVDLNTEDIMESCNVDSESSVYTPSDLCESSVDSIPVLSDSEEMFESKTNLQQTMQEFKKVDFHLRSKSSFDLFGAKQNVGGSVKNFDEDSASSVHTPSELCEYSDESNDMPSLDVHEEIVDTENDYNNNDWQQQTIQDSNYPCEESDKMDWDTGNIDVNSEEAINSFDRNTNFIPPAHSSGKIIIHQNILLKAPFEELTKEINEYDNTVVNNTQHPIEHSYDSKKKEICDDLECKFDSSEAKESTEEAMECCIDSHISISDDEVDNLVNNNHQPIEHSHDSRKKIERCEKTECKFDSSEVKENIEEAMECSIGSHISISDEEVDILESSPASCMPVQMTLTEKHSNSYQHSIQDSFNDGNEMKKSGNVESTFYLPEVKENSKEAISSFDRNTNLILPAHNSKKIIIFPNIIIKLPFEKHTKEVDECDKTIVDNTKHAIEHSHDSSKKIERFEKTECKFDAKENSGQDKCSIDSQISISNEEVEFTESSSALDEAEEAISSLDRNTNLIPPTLSSKKIIIHQNILLKAPIEKRTKEINKYDNTIVNNIQHPIEHSHDSGKKMESCEKTECKFDLSDAKENSGDDKCSIDSHISVSDKEGKFIESSSALGEEAISSFDRNTNFIPPVLSSKKIIINQNILLKAPFEELTKEINEYDNTIVNNTQHPMEHSHDRSKKIERFEKTECKFDAKENSGEVNVSIDSHISISDEEVEYIESSSALGEAEEAISSFDRNTNFSPPVLSSKRIIIHQNILLKPPFQELTKKINEYDNTIVNNTQHPIEHSHDSRKKIERCEKTECKFDSSEAKENIEEAMECSIGSHISISDGEVGILESSPGLSMSERITLTDNHSSVHQHSSQDSYNDGDKMKECEYVGCEFDSSEGKENHKEIIKFSVSSKKQREKDALTETNPLNDSQSLVEGTSDTVIDNEYEVSKNISRNYYMDLTLSNLINCPSMELEEGASYKFRLAATNLNGQGEWSEELLVKSRKVGLPAAPVVYDFVLTKFGACLSWETSSADDRDNVEYSLYLGVKRKKREKPHKMKFKIVYCGHENRCFIRNALLSGARIDTTHSPALIFRLLVKGDNGIGSVNQIRCSNVQTCVNNKTIQQLLREQL